MKCVVPVIMAGIIAVSWVPLHDSVLFLIHIVKDLRSRRVCSHFRQPYVLLLAYMNAYAHGRAVTMEMTLFQGFVQLGAGLSVGLAGLAAGFAIGIVGDAGVRGTAQQPRLFVGMVCLLRFPVDQV